MGRLRGVRTDGVLRYSFEPSGVLDDPTPRGHGFVGSERQQLVRSGLDHTYSWCVRRRFLLGPVLDLHHFILGLCHRKYYHPPMSICFDSFNFFFLLLARKRDQFRSYRGIVGDSYLIYQII